MSNTIDQRVVQMDFDGNKFGSGVSTTLGWLDKLKGALKLDGASSGIDNVNAAAGRVNLGPMSSAVTGVMGQFSALQATAFGALASIGSKAVAVGSQLASSFTTAPIKAGFDEYELKMGSIQTILANTARHGTTLDTVNAEFEKLNAYADQTIYNFGDMTKNVGLFTAAGIKVEDATTMIKGFSNAAATTGTSAEKAAGAAYQLSQSLGDGKITLETWNSLSNAGMGNKNMQDSLVQLADKMGKFAGTGATAESATKSFNKSLEKGWLAPEVMSEYLKIMSGDMDDAAIAALGFSAAEVKGFRDQANMGNDAAKKVRTFTQLMGTLKEAVGSGWSETFGIVFGDFNEATDLFSGLSDAVGGFLNGFAKSRNELLGGWKELGGRTALIDGLKEAFWLFAAPIAQVGQAFRDIFPKATAQDLFNATTKFRDLMLELQPAPETLDRIQRTFAGLFAVLHIGWTVIKAVATFIGKLFMSFSDGDSGILRVTASIGDFLVGLDKAISSGSGLTDFFDTLFGVLMKVINPIKDAGQWLGKMFESFDGSQLSGVADEFGQIGDKLEPLAAVGEKLGGVFEFLGGIFKNIGGKIGEGLAGIGDAIANNFSLANFDRVLDLLNTGLFAVLTLSLKNFLGNFGKGGNKGPSFLDNIKASLEALTGTMEAMQTKLKSDALLGIAIAIGVMAAALLILSLIDADALAKALVAMALGFGIMAAGMVKLSSAIGIMGTLKLPLIAASLVLIAGALLLMALAMKLMATMEIGDMLRGLFGMGAALSVIAGAMKLMPKGMTLQAVALLALGVALNAIALAMKIFATFSWEEMGRGLAAMIGALGGIGIAMRLMPKGILLQSVALNALAVALAAIGLVMKLFATFSWEEMARGVAGMAGSLAGIGIALRLMPKNMLLMSAGLVAVGVALNLIALALKSFGGMSWEEIGKGMVALGGALLILAIALNLMNGTLMGSASLVIATGALMLLTPVLVALGLMSWDAIIKGLVALAGVFTVLGLAGLILAPVIPIILLLAAAILVIGAGLALAGVSALLFATAFTMVVAAGAAGITILAGILATFIDALPGVIQAFAEGIVKFVQIIADNGPAFLGAFSTIIGSLLDAVIENVPKMGEAFTTMILTALDVIVTLAPAIFDAGLNLIMGFLRTIRDNIGPIVDIAADIIVNFIDGISRNLPRIIQSGIDLIISFVNGVADGIRNNSAAMGEAGGNLATAIVEGMVKGIGAGIGKVVQAAKDLAKSAFNAAKDFLDINSPSKKFIELGKSVNEGFAVGIRKDRGEIEKAAEDMAGKLSDAMETAGKNAADAADKIEKLTAARDEDNRAIAEANRDLKDAQGKQKVSANQVRDLQAKIQKLTEKRDADNAAIRESTVAMEEANHERDRAAAAYKYVTESMTDEMNKLSGLADSYDDLTKKLDDANKTLDDAKKTRDDYNNSIRDQYDNLPDISNETKVSTFVEDLKKQIENTRKFATALQKLRGMGLNDELYKQLLAKGPDSLPFVDELLTGGRGKVNEINSLQTSLEDAASGLGETASASLYQAAVDSADGLVAGLKSKQDEVKAEMDAMADAMVKAVKDRLGIQSPSTVMAEQGDYATQGLVKGLTDAGPTVALAGADIVGVLVKAVSDAVLLNTAALTAQGYSMGTAMDQGMVDGINAGSGSIYAAAAQAASAALAAAKIALGIASPSKEFVKIGQWSSEGMAVGLYRYSGLVSDAASTVGRDAIVSMQKTISGLGNLISADVDVNPVISPVLDLTSIKKDAALMNSMLATQPITVGAAYSTARVASAGHYENRQSAMDQVGSAAPVAKSVTFVQNNNSPKALSSATIYRQTNNQLSKVKGALDD